VSAGALKTADRRVLREARTEAVIVLLLDVALLVGLAVGDKAKGWSIVDLPWWAWLLLAAPALVLIVLLLAVPLAELSPGRVRNAGIALLGLLVASDAGGRALPAHGLAAVRRSDSVGGAPGRPSSPRCNARPEP
jgi:hypothetical protein